MDENVPTWVENLTDIAVAPDGSGEPTFAPVHQTAFAQAVVQLVPVGAAIEAHRHTALWDYFIGLSGIARIALSRAEDRSPISEHIIKPGGFLAVPPGTTHEIRCAGTDGPFVFLLMQAPYAAYDFVVEPADGAR